MFQPTITKEEIRKLPKKNFEGRIIVIDNFPSLKKYITVIQKEKLWGFDTETRPAFKRGVVNKPAMVQFANEAYALLFRLREIGLPDELVEIISDPSIVKVGAAIHDDLKNLTLHRNFNPAGFIDLQKYAVNFGIESKGLVKLAAIVLNFRISKSQQVSNWENKQLTRAQKIYAATDAWACYRIYQELQKVNSRMLSRW